MFHGIEEIRLTFLQWQLICTPISLHKLSVFFNEFVLLSVELKSDMERINNAILTDLYLMIASGGLYAKIDWDTGKRIVIWYENVQYYVLEPRDRSNKSQLAIYVKKKHVFKKQETNTILKRTRRSHSPTPYKLKYFIKLSLNAMTCI